MNRPIPIQQVNSASQLRPVISSILTPATNLKRALLDPELQEMAMNAMNVEMHSIEIDVIVMVEWRIMHLKARLVARASLKTYEVLMYVMRYIFSVADIRAIRIAQ
ncbi:hypothetical protein Tco_0945899 [Tanacetum coccineum]